jgi:energy-coupling factor transport system permease protein
VDPFLYLDRDTWVHRLDPRTKMLLLVGMFVLGFLFENPLYGLVVLAAVLLFGYAARSLVNLKRIWFILVTIAVMTVILWTIFGSGETPLFWFVEREAVLYGIGAALRIDITIVAGMIFLSTTRNEEIATGLVKLGIPYRFALALESKGFGASPERTYFLEIGMTRRDALVLVVFAVLLVAALALRFAGFGGVEGFSR